jgi:hypothetical protein
MAYSPLDLKEMDLAKIIQILQEKKILVLNIVVIIIALFFLKSFYEQFKAKENAQQERIARIQNKIGIITDYDKKLKELNNYINSLPKEWLEDKIIMQITDYAVANHVEITSFAPGAKRSEATYDLTKVNLSIVASDYSYLIKFIRALEASPYALRVDSWTGNMEEDEKTGMRIKSSLELAYLWINK